MPELNRPCELNNSCELNNACVLNNPYELNSELGSFRHSGAVIRAQTRFSLFLIPTFSEDHTEAQNGSSFYRSQLKSI